MTRLLSAEIFKLRTTRTFYGLVGGSLALVLTIVILVTALVNFSPSDRPLTDMMGVAGFVQVFALMLGILSITTEFRHGTITPSLLVVPDRVRLVLAKLGASIAVGLALGLVATVLVALIVKGIGGLRDLDTSGDVVPLIIGGTIATGLYAALGVGRRRDHAQPGRRDHRLARLPVRAREPAADHPRRRRRAAASTGSAASAAASRAPTSPATCSPSCRPACCSPATARSSSSWASR